MESPFIEFEEKIERLKKKVEEYEIRLSLLPVVITSLESELKELREALLPFSKLDLTGLENNVDSIPVYGRNHTVITKGDFLFARSAIQKARSSQKDSTL